MSDPLAGTDQTSAPSDSGAFQSEAPALPTPAAGAPPTTPTDPSGGKPSLWKGVLQGALQGLAGAKGATHFGGGLAAGAAGQQAYVQQQKENELQQQASKRADTQLQMTAKVQDAQAAQALAGAAMNNARAAALPQESKDAHDQVQLGLMEHLQSMGIAPIAVFDDTHDGAVSAANQIGNTLGAIPHTFNVEVPGSNGIQHMTYNLNALASAPQGLVLVNQMREASGQQSLTPQQWGQTPKAAQTQALENAGKFMAPPAPKNALEANGTYLQYKSTADAYAKKPNADPQVLAGLQSLTTKLKGIADGMSNAERKQKVDEAVDKSNIETAAMKRQDAQPWVVGATAMEKNKAAVAENVAANAGDIATILHRRPDILGAIAGRYTQIQQMVGNNDPDISAVAVALSNIAKGNSSIHGLRSVEGIRDTEKLILNNFKNGPAAVGGALRETAKSAQTFIDIARPEKYKTHSKMGGAVNGAAK